MTTDYFFNADGTAGIRKSQGSQSVCDADYSYSLRGDSLTMTSAPSEAAPGGGSQLYTVSSSNGRSSSLTLFTTGSCDGGACTGTLTRVNSNPTNSCP